MGEYQIIEPQSGACARVHAARDLFVHEAEQGLRSRMPELCASTVITRNQVIALSMLTVAVLCGVAASPEIAFFVLVALSSLSLLAGTGFRGILTFLGGQQIPCPALDTGDCELPIYTILVPLYREANVLPRLAQELAQLDYPDILAQTPQAI